MGKAALNEVDKLMRVKENVAYILESDPGARDSDTVLTVAYLKTYCSINTLDELLVKKHPSFEAIRRARQKLQEEGFCPSSKRIEKAKQHMEEAYRNFVKIDA